MFDYQIVKKNSFAYAETGLGELWRESTLEEPLAAANNINQYQRKKTLSSEIELKTEGAREK